MAGAGRIGKPRAWMVHAGVVLLDPFDHVDGLAPAVEMFGKLTENVPPNPQHCSTSPNSTTFTPAIELSNVSAAAMLPVPRV